MKILWDAKILSVLSFLNHHFFIFKNDVQTKIKNYDIKSSKHFKFLHPTRFSYKEFNEHDKLKFGDELIYFLS
jgi:hypothetical protein